MSKGLSQENAKAISILTVVAVVIVIAIIVVKKFFGGLSGLSQTIGLSDSPEVAAAKTTINTANAGGSSSYWSPNFYENAPASARIITSNSARTLSENIWNAYGFFSFADDPEEALSAFKQLPSKTAVSYLANMFYITYSADLLGWLTKKSDTDNDKKVLAQIISYCDSLPAY